jgi:hypothetical protein
VIDLRLHDHVAAQARLVVQLLVELRNEDDRLFERRPEVIALAEGLLCGLGDIAVACSEDGSGPVTAPEVIPDPDARRRTYRELVERICDRVAALLPAGSTVAVVSRGDGALVQIPGLDAWHFPQNELGVWAGYHPETGEEAVELALGIQAKGAGYLLIPATAFWWLDFYEPLREYVRSDCRLVAEDRDFVLFEFPTIEQRPSPPASGTIESRRHRLMGGQFRNFVGALLPTGATVLVVTRGDDGLLPQGVRARHFPSDAHGTYLGTPANDLEVLSVLERAIAGGAEYLAVPRSMDWWIEMYPALRQRIRSVYPCIADRRETGSIFHLTAPTHLETT